MRRPWQIWLLYALGLAIVLPAMAWLTLKALELDRAEAVARRQAELEEDVSRALWRMDSLLTPLLAEEAARPDFVYRPAYRTVPAKGDSQAEQISPLLADPPQYVLLHFEVRGDGSVTSPQCPGGKLNAWAVDNGASSETIAAAERRLAELQPALSRDELLAQLPASAIASSSAVASATPQVDGQDTSANTQVIENAFDDLSQQVGQQQAIAAANPQPPAPDAFLGAQQQEGDPFGIDSADGPPRQAAAQPTAPQIAAQQSREYGANIESGRLQRPQSRAGNDLPNRGAALQAYAQRSFAEQRSNLKPVEPVTRVLEGASKPLWLGDRLILARRVQIGDDTVIQGCWLDWPALHRRLREEVADLLPHVTLSPVRPEESIKLSRLLATIPVQLKVPAPSVEPAPWSPIRVSLLAAWSCLLLAAVAAAVTLQSIITLSERRAAFVSAVTHELRTPLTTFRMYAEMLAEGMVPDADQRQRYLQTLRIEADRLSHLVENVLQYARLERGRPGKRREPTTVGALLDHCQLRLIERAEQAEMKLLVEMDEAERDTSLATDAAAVEQILFNLVDNACKYAAANGDRRIHLKLQSEPRYVQFALRDHGPGISSAGRRKLFRPFSKSVHEAASSAPGVGLGLALSRRLAADLGGTLQLNSPGDGGAEFVLSLPR